MNTEQVAQEIASTLELRIISVLGTKVQLRWTPLPSRKGNYTLFYQELNNSKTQKSIKLGEKIEDYLVGKKSSEILKRGKIYSFWVTFNGLKSNTVSTTILHYPVKWGIVKGYSGDRGIDIESAGACNKNRGGITCLDYLNKKNKIKKNTTMKELIEHNKNKIEGTPHLTQVFACAPGKIVQVQISEKTIVPKGGTGSWYFVTQELEFPVYYKEKAYKFVWYMHLHNCKQGLKDHKIVTVGAQVGTNLGNLRIGYNLVAGYHPYLSEHLHFGIAEKKERYPNLEYNEACQLLGVKPYKKGEEQVISR